MNEGLTQRAIAHHLNMSQSAVSRIILRHRITGQYESSRRGRCGRHRSLSARSARHLARESLLNPRSTAFELQRAVGDPVSSLSISTVKRSLIRSGRFTYRPVKSPSWTKQQMKVRLDWAIRHRHWTAEQWKKVFLVNYKIWKRKKKNKIFSCLLRFCSRMNQLLT